MGAPETADVAAFTGTVPVPTITQTGSVLTFNAAGTNTGTVSSTITVPSDAEIVVVGVSGWRGDANYFSSGSMTFTKGGTDTAMVSATGAGDADGAFFNAAVFYQALPDTGTNKSLKWDWLAAGTATDPPIISVTFWKGVDTSSPVRDADGAQKGTPYTGINTPTLTAQSGDKIIAWAAWFGGAAEGSIDTWSNLIELSEFTKYGNADAAWATSDPTGNTTVGVVSGTNLEDGGLVAIVLKPAVESTVVQTGSTLTFPLSDVSYPATGIANTGTVSTTITVPADAELVAVGVTGYMDDALTDGQMTFTKGGADTAMVGVGGADLTSGQMAALFYLVLPDTGTNKSLKWNWAGSSATQGGSICSVTFWKGLDTASPVRSSGGAQAGAVPYTTPTLTAQAGDRVVAYAGFFAFAANEASINTWSNATLLTQLVNTGAGDTDGAWATGSPTGNTTVSALTGTDTCDGGIVAIVLKPAAAGFTGTLATTEGADTPAFTGTVRWQATLATTEAPDTAAFTGTTRWVATLATTEAPDVAAFTGTVRWTAVLSTTEAADVASFLGTTSWIATLAVTEGSDTAAFNGIVRDPITSTLATTEAADVAAFNGTVGDVAITGTFSPTELPDIGAFTGGIYATGILSTTELPDLAAFTGTVFTPVTGTLGTTEAPDIAAFVGNLGAPANAGPLAVIEPPDISAFTGTVRWNATLAASEAPDIALFTGSALVLTPPKTQVLIMA